MRISDWSSDVCSSDLLVKASQTVFLSMAREEDTPDLRRRLDTVTADLGSSEGAFLRMAAKQEEQENRLKHVIAETRQLMITELRQVNAQDRKSTRLNSSH